MIMKQIIVENFDGAVMSAIVGERVTLDENKALQLAADITKRLDAESAKADRVVALQDELNKLTDEMVIAAPALEADTTEAKTLVLQFVQLYRKNGYTVPPALDKFIADIDTPTAPPEIPAIIAATDDTTAPVSAPHDED